MTKSTSTVWNRDRHVGERIAFSISEAQSIQATLSSNGSLHDACLFSVGVDTMLRSSDLLRLKVRDLVHPYGEVRKEILQRQKKTGLGVAPVLTETTRDAITSWVRASGKGLDHFLFTRCKANNASPITSARFRSLIKRWAGNIGLNDERYSAHSLRRTKPSYLYHYGLADIATIAIMLGHADAAVTIRYLGISKSEAQEIALDGDIFTGDPNAVPLGHSFLGHFLKPEFLDQFSKALATEIAPKVAQLNHNKTQETSG